MQIENEVEQLSLFDQDGCAGRMSQERSPRPRVKTSRPSFKKSQEWQTSVCQSLNLRTGSGNLLGKCWEIRFPLLGESSTPNFSVLPKEEIVCSLSRTLQDQAPRKYYLSQKACRGILSRVRHRGKELPPLLEAALQIQAGYKSWTPLEEKEPKCCLNDQGGRFMNTSYNVTATLRAQMDGHSPLVFDNHSQDTRYTGPVDVCPTINAGYGEGGNNTAFAIQQYEKPAESYCISGHIIDRGDFSGGNGLGVQEDICFTLTTSDRHSVFSLQRSDEYKKNDVTCTQAARQSKDATDLVVEEPALLIRRITPLECERLQGFPDNWTLVDGASDAQRYKALGNSVAVPCVEYILRGIVQYIATEEEKEGIKMIQ